MLRAVQVTSILILALIHANAEAPPGYVKPAEPVDKNPPKYEYGYNIEDEKGAAQGKIETRDGIYALGRYYVQGVDSTQNVQYYADDWGYHPFIEYSSVGPHSKTRTQLLLGVEAVKALASNKFTSQSVPPKQHVTDTINSKTANKNGNVIAAPQITQKVAVQQPQQIIIEQRQPQQVLVQQPVVEQPQQIVVQQPQQIVVQQPQQIVVQQPQHIVAQQPQQIIVQQPQQIIAQQPQQIVQIPQQIEQAQQIEVGQQVGFGQLQQVGSGQLQQTEVQSQEIAADGADSVTVEAFGRQSQQNNAQSLSQQQSISQLQQQGISQLQQQGISQLQQQGISQLQQQGSSQLQQQGISQLQQQPQVEQVLFQQQLSYQQPEGLAQQRFTQPQLEQVQIGQEISHQQISESLPQSLALQSNLVQDSSKEIQENLIANQQAESAALLENARSNNLQVLQQQQINLGGFGSRINLLGRRRPAYNARIQSNSEKLIDSTRNLVSGQDVLNINGALGEIETNIEASTARSVAAETLQQGNQNLIGINTVTESSLLNQPIVVADLDEKFVSSTENLLNLGQGQEQIYSTTANTVETVSTKSFGVTEPSAVLVTPRPISTQFLAPITAGIQLQNIDNNLQLQSAEDTQNVATRIQLQNIQGNQKIQSGGQQQNYVVEIQKSLPFYLGKFEYEQNLGSLGAIEQAAISQSGNLQQKAVDNIELGKTLLAFPGSKSEQQQVQLKQQQSGDIQLQQQQLPEGSIKENFVDLDQQQAQGIQHQVAIQSVTPVPFVVEKIVEKQVPVPVVETKYIERPVTLTKIVREPYPVGVPVHVPVQIPVTVEKRVPYPVTVEKIVEKPVTVTEIVEKRVNVPQPYPVERIVEKPVHVPVEVTKYIDRPYPVQVRVAHPVPYPVDRVVEKIVKQPYPVEVKIPVEVKVPVQVEKIVERKVPVPQYIDRPVPIDRIVEKLVPHYIDRPYPVQVEVPVGQVYALQPSTKTVQPALTLSQLVQPSQRHSVAIKTINDYRKQEGQLQGQQLQLQGQQLQFQGQQLQLQGQGNLRLDQNVFLQGSTRSNGYLPPPQPQVQNSYLPPVHDCDQHNSLSTKNAYYTIPADDYIGLSPPGQQGNLQNLQNAPRKFRNARSNFNSNPKLEYGFMPPLRPSQEIDEHGNPITREKP